MAKFNVCSLSTLVLALSSSLPCAEGYSKMSSIGNSWRLRQHRQRSVTTMGVGLETDEMLQPQKKYIVVTGGVISGIGKGVTASSIGVLLKMLNLRPTAIKIDPYLNVDAGTMSPFEHGEVFVLDDGSETDLDLGNYERFLDVRLTNDSNLTTGKVYQTVVAKERKGEYLGKTVQIIPHVTNEIMNRITRYSHHHSRHLHRFPPVAPDLASLLGALPGQCVEGAGGRRRARARRVRHRAGRHHRRHRVHALRGGPAPAAGMRPPSCCVSSTHLSHPPHLSTPTQLRVKRENFCLVHVSMVPIVGEDAEQKTKPTQHSVKELRVLGLTPDFVVCRAAVPIHKASREKIAMMCRCVSVLRRTCSRDSQSPDPAPAFAAACRRRACCRSTTCPTSTTCRC